MVVLSFKSSISETVPLFISGVVPKTIPYMQYEYSLHGLVQCIDTCNFEQKSLQDFVNTLLLVHKHVTSSVDKWIFETTHSHKHVAMFGIFFGQFLCSEQK